jgi:exosortase/archaeosortase family protein
MNRSIAPAAAIDRPTLYFWVFLIAAANKLAGMILVSVTSVGWASSAFNLFGVSAILWVALVAGLLLVRGGHSEPIRRDDFAIAVLVICAAIVPIYSASAAALALASFYAIVTNPPGSGLRRGSIIFLAMTSSLIWGPLLLTFFNGPILRLDAYLVSHLAGAHAVGNQVQFIGSSDAFLIAAGCSSFHGMSLAVVFWATVNQWFEVRFTWASLLWIGAALVATIGINAMRMVAIAHFPDHFDALHVGWGAQLAAWATLILVVAICVYGARRDVLAAP